MKLKLHIDNSLMTEDKNTSCQQAFGKKAGSVLADSFVLRNPPERKAQKRKQTNLDKKKNRQATAHFSSFGCQITRATASKPKELKFSLSQ
jgi:hypothetical protein